MSRDSRAFIVVAAGHVVGGVIASVAGENVQGAVLGLGVPLWLILAVLTERLR